MVELFKLEIQFDVIKYFYILKIFIFTCFFGVEYYDLKGI